MTTSSRGPTSGRFSRACARSAERRSKRSSRRPNAAVASSACVCRRRTTEKRSRGRPRRRGTARSRRSSANCLETLELVLGNQIYIAKEGLHPGLRNRLLRLAAFQNPEFYKAQAMRLSTYDKPRVIACAEDHPHHIGLPRGCLDDVRQALTDLGVRTAIRDERYAGRPSGRELSWRAAAGAEGGGRRDAGARDRRAGRHDGVWQDGGRRLAHRTARRQHARARASAATARPVDRAARQRSSACPRSRSVASAAGEADRPGCSTSPSFRASSGRASSTIASADYGHLIVDECHHLSAHSFEQVARQAKARFVAGLSATVARKDGHHPDHLHAVRTGSPSSERDERRRRPGRSSTSSSCSRRRSSRARSPDADKRVEFQALYQELVDDELRNSSHLRRRHRVA